jgi:hypothetical protein
MKFTIPESAKLGNGTLEIKGKPVLIGSNPLLGMTVTQAFNICEVAERVLLF